ncbi:MAG: hypothetical protein ACM31C_04960 [Acidobacteriota bacterium]
MMVLLVACTGCAQLLGLDSTKFDYKDAMVDAPSVCDGAPACTSTTGRSVCGIVIDTGANAGTPLRVASPTGGACTTADGPCALTVYGQTKADFFAGASTQVAGTIDDCGRFVVPDLDANAADVAVVLAAASNVTTATLVLERPTSPGTDTNVLAYAVATTTAASWGSQLSPASPPTISSGYLVTQADAAGAPLAGESVWVNGGPVAGPPTVPWSAYFTDRPFGALDPAQTMTAAGGTSLVLPATGSFMLGGARTGKTCKQITVQLVTDVLIHVTLSC